MNFSEVLIEIVNIRTKEVLKDDMLFMAMFSDLAPDLTKEKKIMKRICEDKMLNRFYMLITSQKSEHVSRTVAIETELRDDLGFSEEWINTVISAFTEAFKLSTSIQKTKTTPPSPKQPQIKPTVSKTIVSESKKTGPKKLKKLSDEELKREIICILQESGNIGLRDQDIVKGLEAKGIDSSLFKRVITPMVYHSVLEYRANVLYLLYVPDNLKVKPIVSSTRKSTVKKTTGNKKLSDDALKREIIDILRASGNAGLKDEIIIARLETKGIDTSLYKRVITQMVIQRIAEYRVNKVYLLSSFMWTNNPSSVESLSEKMRAEDKARDERIKKWAEENEQKSKHAINICENFISLIDKSNAGTLASRIVTAKQSYDDLSYQQKKQINPSLERKLLSAVQLLEAAKSTGQKLKKLKIGDKISFKNHSSLNTWTVLENNENGVLLINRTLCISFADSFSDTSWENSKLRAHLNSNEFLTMNFSDAERMLIRESRIENNENKKFGIGKGKDTVDKVFILSAEELPV